MNITDKIYQQKIKPLFAQSTFCSVATVNDEGIPHVSPIGSIVLLNKDKGMFFEKFTKNVPKNTQKNSYATIMCVNDGKWFWLKSLL
ncbi:MAG: pyridoxamine 5'-phosphate oxidase family protein, partial [Marinicellaceae bacterium]